MPTVICRSIYGHSVEVPREKLVFRIGVYAVIHRENKVLLMTNRSSGKFAFPGGGVDMGETLEGALKRELREEAGIEIEMIRFLNFRENFFYYDPKDEALHGFQFYYLYKPMEEVTELYTALDDESEKSRWVDWNAHPRQEFQIGEEYDLLMGLSE